MLLRMTIVLWVRLWQLSAAAAAEDPSVVEHWDALYTESVYSSVVKDFIHAWQGVDLMTLRGVLGPRLNEAHKDLRFLVLGAGDSGLPEELFDAGWRNITAIDFSSVIVRAMASRSQGDFARPGLEWRIEDARKLALAEDTFDVAIDVGMLDTVATSGSDQAAQVLLEVHRVLRAGGGYISVSTEPPLFRQPLFAQHPPGGWVTEVLSLPRPREIDPRIRALDPVISPGRLHPMLDVGRINVYVSRVPGGTPALHAQESADSGAGDQESAGDAKVGFEASTGDIAAEAALGDIAAEAFAGDTAAEGGAAVEATLNEAAVDAAPTGTSSEAAPGDAPATPSEASEQPPSTDM